MKIPKNLAQVADLYKQARDKRLAMEKEAAKQGVIEKLYKEHLIDNLPKSKVGGISGQLARVEVVNKDIPFIEDRKKFFAYVRKTNQQELLTQSLNAAAVKERWEAKKKIPGVGKHVVTTLSLHSIKPQRNK